MSEAKKIDLGYEPRPYQEKLHREFKRFNVIVAHRRFGKTHCTLAETIDRGLRNPVPDPQYAYLSPSFTQSKRIAWDVLKKMVLKIPGTTTNEQELRADIPRPWIGDRVRIMLLGAENPGSLRGIYLDGCVLDEYAEMSPVIWGEVIRPALSDRKGWAVFIGTPKGQNHFYDLWNYAESDPTWYNKLFKASDTGVVDEDELEAAKREMSEEEFNQEYECSFNASMMGAYYAKRIRQLEEKKQVCRVPYDSSLFVDTYWDLGIGDSTAIWFVQSFGKEHRVIDYLEDHGKSIGDYAKLLAEKGYDYGETILPHDVAVRSLDTGKSRLETFRKHGFKRIRVLDKAPIEEGIEAVRNILPLCWFDADRCKKGLDALRNYQRKWDPKNKVFMQKPKHDWSSHGADAFRYFAMGQKDEIDTSTLPAHAESEYDVFSV